MARVGGSSTQSGTVATARSPQRSSGRALRPGESGTGPCIGGLYSRWESRSEFGNSWNRGNIDCNWPNIALRENHTLPEACSCGGCECGACEMAEQPRRGTAGRSYTPAPAALPAFPGTFKVKPKTRRKGAAYRKRWKDPSGAIYEWDSQHGTIEKYDAQGRHLGEYDPDTGEELKPADPSWKVEP